MLNQMYHQSKYHFFIFKMIYPEIFWYLWILGRFLAQRQINKVPDGNVNALFKSHESSRDFFFFPLSFGYARVA